MILPDLAMWKSSSRIQAVKHCRFALILLLLFFSATWLPWARRFTSTQVCGAYAHVDKQKIISIKQIRRCRIDVSVGRQPVYKFGLFNNPGLSGGGRQQPVIALELRKGWARPDSTVVTSVYNAAPALKRSLPNLFVKTTGLWELVIVLDACYDDSYSTAVTVIQEYFARSECVRVQVIIQPTAIWEVSSDNIGMRITNPKVAYILLQADTVMLEKGWNTRLLRKLNSDRNIFAISGRCGHSLDLKETFGRCGAEVAEPLPHGTLRDVFYQTETVNRGPLALRSHQAQALGFLDETRFLLEDDDHDLNSRARSLGYIVGYMPVDFYAPLDLSARRNPQYRVHTPQHIVQQEQEYKQYRLTRSQNLP